ncbi:MAG: hypothetical protein LBC73_06925 [Oscillospiraceae bacterium]|nr:hypothetical protein [Oscillospiraceae bacterium]
MYRINEHLFVSGYDIVIVARTGSKEAVWNDLQSSVLHLFSKLGLLK